MLRLSSPMCSTHAFALWRNRGGGEGGHRWLIPVGGVRSRGGCAHFRRTSVSVCTALLLTAVSEGSVEKRSRGAFWRRVARVSCRSATTFGLIPSWARQRPRAERTPGRTWRGRGSRGRSSGRSSRGGGSVATLPRELVLLEAGGSRGVRERADPLSSAGSWRSRCGGGAPEQAPHAPDPRAPVRSGRLASRRSRTRRSTPR